MTCVALPSTQKDIASMTEVHGVSAPTQDEVKTLLRKVERIVLCWFHLY